MRLFGTDDAAHFATTAALVGVLALSLLSCSDNTVGTSGYDADLELTGVQWQSPDSSEAPEELNPGDLIALQGRNMDAVGNVYFNGVEASFNPALASEDRLVVSVPGDLPFGELDPESEEFGTIRVANSSSEAQMEFPVLPPSPVLREMSNEHAFPGDEVTLYGQYLYLVESISFPNDVTISGEDVNAATDGSSVTFTLPEAVSTAMNGNVSITTTAGTDDSDPAFLFHEFRDVIVDMRNSGNEIAPPVHDQPQIEQWGYWAAIHPYSGDVYQSSGSDHTARAEGDFIIVENAGRSEIGEGNGAWWGNHRSVNLNGSTEWVAPENLDESTDNFAVKFEMSIHGEWNSGAFQIILPETNYAALVQPWFNEQGGNTPVSYDGWRTYTVPLSEFASDGGSGGTTNNLEALLGSDGVAGTSSNGDVPALRFLNAAPAEVSGAVQAGTSFAIDKLRVVRIAEAE